MTDYNVDMWFFSIEIVCVLVVMLLGLGLCLWLRRKHVHVPLAIKKKSKLLSASEKTFLEILINALGNDYFVFVKIGVMGVVDFKVPLKGWQRKMAVNVIDSSTFDFVLVEPINMSPFAVIELQDFSDKNRKNRKKREKQLTRICDAANIKVFYFNVRDDFSKVDLARLITGKSRRKAPTNVDHQTLLEEQSRSCTEGGVARTCPKCRQPLVTKVATAGSRIGEKFHLCKRYPSCDFRISAKDTRTLKGMDYKESKWKDAAKRPVKHWVD